MLVLPGDQLPLLQPTNNATLHLHLGPGTAQTTPRDHQQDADHTLYVARKMGLVQTSNKRRKVRDGPGEVQTRIWIDVEAKRVSPFPLSYLRRLIPRAVRPSRRGIRHRRRHRPTRRIIQSRHRDRPDRAAESVCVRGRHQADEAALRGELWSSALRGNRRVLTTFRGDGDRGICPCVERHEGYGPRD